jgi:hypothetical protein
MEGHNEVRWKVNLEMKFELLEHEEINESLVLKVTSTEESF